jgi:signal transduction histidine kinase
MMLRESEKLATIGRISAGMAHELNNPASAAQRASAHLLDVLEQLQDAYQAAVLAGLSAEHWSLLLTQARRANERAGYGHEADPLIRHQREADIERWLSDRGVDAAWEIAPILAQFDYDLEELDALAGRFPLGAVSAVASWLCNVHGIHHLLSEINLSTCRISEVVNSVKAYSYLDRAPIQSVDVNADIDNTLALLKSRLGENVLVRREYDRSLPRIQAYGSELNQVWTRLIENAIDAVGGHGEIVLRTSQDGDCVVVEVQDDGPGIPAELQSRVFDPFFTTKPPGHGAGLGLTITLNIVAQKHGGQMELASRPGFTCFRVRLPLTLETGDEPGK